MSDPIALSLLALDLPMPATGWAAELGRRGIAIVLDDIGRRAIPRDAARRLLAEHEEQEARKARHREEVERQAIAADQAFRATLPPGIRADAVPVGMTAGMLMCASDPLDGEGPERRVGVLEHALANPTGAIIYHAVEGASDYSAGGDS